MSPEVPKQLLNCYVQAVRSIREELGEEKPGVCLRHRTVLQGLGLPTLDSDIAWFDITRITIVV